MHLLLQPLFLPGTSGDINFWKPVANQLNHKAKPIFFDWLGFSEIPADSSITNLADLTNIALAKIDKPTALIVHSMGGIIAVQAALRRPDLITHLILTVTSGGVDMTQFGAKDWRSEFMKKTPIYLIGFYKIKAIFLRN